MTTLSPSNQVRRERIALVSCVHTQAPFPAAARDLYVSPLFQKSQAWAEMHCDRWFILSSKYGMIDPDMRVEPYDVDLRKQSIGERRAWAKRSYAQMQALNILKPDTTFVWLASKPYRDELRLLLGRYNHEDPLQHLQIGQRLHWLDANL